MSPSLEQVAKSLQNFGWSDYAVFALMLISCMGIGVYFSHNDSKKRKKSELAYGSEALEYLVGGHKMKVFPVSMSLVASMMSGIGLLGTSTEIYVYGSHYMFMLVALVLAGITLHYFFLPVYQDLRLTSMYEYLDRRFDRSLRLLGSVIFLLSTFFKMPIMIYVPALAFNQVTGVNIYVTTPIVCLICVFYTCIGGLKAVVWTDVIQGLIMMGSLVIVAIKATISVGGLGLVIKRNLNSARIESPIFDLDPTIRTSVWSTVIGGWAYYISVNGIEQSMIQRYVSLPTLREARKAVWIFVAGVAFITGFSMYNGFLLHALYHDCDPLSTGLAKQKDQLIPLLVMDIMGQYPLMSGIFIAAVFSASLSSLSTGLNSMTAVILEDFIKLIYRDRLTEKSTAYIMRGTVIITGFVTTALVFVVEKLGPVLGLAISLAGVTYGPLLGVFIIGLAMPWVGARPTMIGAIVGLISAGWIVFKAQVDTAAGILTYAEKPVTTAGCLYTFNTTTIHEPKAESIKEFYHLSYFYYCVVGIIVTIIVANLFTLVLGKQDLTKLDLSLLTPRVRQIYETKRDRATIFNVPSSKELVTENSCTNQAN